MAGSLLLILVLGVLAFILTVFFLPLGISFTVNWEGLGQYTLALHLRQLGGILALEEGEIRFAGLTLRKFGEQKERGLRQRRRYWKPSLPGFHATVKKILPLLNGEVCRAIARLFARLGKGIKLRLLEVEGSFGFPDPALTGFTSGLLSSIPVFWEDTVVTVKLTPVFTEEVIAGKIAGNGQVVVGRLIFAVICFALAPPVRRIWWGHLRESIGRRKGWRRGQKKEGYTDGL